MYLFVFLQWSLTLYQSTNLDWSKLKALADDKTNVNEKIIVWEV